jgi:GxxExxY protein
VNDPEELGKIALSLGIQLHKELGPGLLESVYEAILADMFMEKGLFVERQKVIPVIFRGKVFDEMFRADLIIENTLLIELKSTEHFAPVGETAVGVPYELRADHFHGWFQAPRQ